MNHRLDIVILATVLLFAGCNETRVTSPKTRRPPADQGEVTIFQAPPREYQLLGTVRSDTEVTRERDFTAQPIIEELRAKSAAMGGNGLLLEVPGAETTDGVTRTGGGLLSHRPSGSPGGETAMKLRALVIDDSRVMRNMGLRDLVLVAPDEGDHSNRR